MSGADSVNIIISKAKNGSTTCSADNIFIHSSYNPQREAQSFTASLAVDFSPACLLIIEPALSYCLPFLRDRFPQAELACVRLDSAFRSYDQGWDFVF